MDFQIQMGGLGQRSYCMKKEKHYEFVSRKEYQPYLLKTNRVIQLLIKKLKAKGIRARFYIIGSAGKRNLVTRLIINNEKQAFDVDVNIEIELSSVPQKYKELRTLKELIRTDLNKSIKESDSPFSDGCNSTSAITVPLYDEHHNLKFSFDLGIVSRNKNDDLQRLLFKKEQNVYKWEMLFTSDLEFKFKSIRTNSQWNTLRTAYLNLKNRFMNDKKHPSYVCYKMAVNDTYNQLSEEEMLDGMDFDEIEDTVKNISFEECLNQLNTLYQKKLISKPVFKYPKSDDDNNYRCECFITSIEHLEGYWDRGIGEDDNRVTAQKRAAYDILDFLINGNDADEDNEKEVYYCPYCGAEKDSEYEICPYCNDDD